MSLNHYYVILEFVKSNLFNKLKFFDNKGDDNDFCCKCEYLMYMYRVIAFAIKMH